MSDNDLIRRGDAIAACAVGPSDEWARATKSGYTQAATDCTFNVLRIPAVQVTVKPGEIERAVWSAMIWAADNNPGFNGVPEYTDCGNSFAETECRSAAARIRSAIPAVPAPDAEKVAALVDAADAADAILNAYSAIFRVGNPWGDNLRAALAAMKEV